MASLASVAFPMHPEGLRVAGPVTSVTWRDPIRWSPLAPMIGGRGSDAEGGFRGVWFGMRCFAPSERRVPRDRGGRRR